MKRLLSLVLLSLLATSCATSSARRERERLAAQANNEALRQVIVSEIRQAPLLAHPSEVQSFYEQRAYRSAWVNNFKLRNQAKDFFRMIQEAENEGLRPTDYHSTLLEKLFENKTAGKLHSLARADILLTDAFLSYASHLRWGRFPPQSLEIYWKKDREDRPDFVALLQEASKTGKAVEELMNLAPKHAGYVRLREALLDYRKLTSKGGWRRMPEGPKLKKGDRGERVEILKNRLGISDGKIFDDELEKVVKDFQSRHGLEADGKVGKGTLAALNVSIEKRIHQIKSNLDRWLWLPRDLGDPHIFVNIPDFRLSVIEGGKEVMGLNVVVGQKKDWNTPLLSSRVTQIIVNPPWNVPPDIFKKEVLVEIQKDPTYLMRENMQVLDLRQKPPVIVDPATVDWINMDAEHSPYQIVQREGDTSALGRLKFLFPNPFAVYLHDTPSKNSFKQRLRALSHGCVRVEKPLDMAEYLLKSNTGWTRKKIEKEIATNKSQTFPLKKHVNLHIVYFTAWVDEEGRVQFREDIYKKDE